MKNACTEEGIYRASNGNIYCGRFINGLMYGIGSRTSFDGNNYVGDYLFGRSEGQGTYIWQNQYKYVGVWVSNE